MYVKIHDSIFSSSIMEEDLEIRYIWLCMLTAADYEGYVDETIPALARKFTVSKELMEKAITCFLSPDPNSRTEDKDGVRLVKLRKSFGWKIVNYEKYRNMRNTEDRREYMRNYMRDYMRKYREKEDKSDSVKQESLTRFTVKQVKPKQKQKQNNIYKERAQNVIQYLNETYDRKFSFTDGTLKHAIARLKEGFTEEDLKRVIDTKWNDEKFDKKYFRPSTLFNSEKFEGYLNEKPTPRYT